MSRVSRSDGAAVPGGATSTWPASATPDMRSVAAVAPRTPKRMAAQIATGNGRNSSGEWTSPRTPAKYATMPAAPSARNKPPISTSLAGGGIALQRYRDQASTGGATSRTPMPSPTIPVRKPRHGVGQSGAPASITASVPSDAPTRAATATATTTANPSPRRTRPAWKPGHRRRTSAAIRHLVPSTSARAIGGVWPTVPAHAWPSALPTTSAGQARLPARTRIASPSPAAGCNHGTPVCEPTNSQLSHVAPAINRASAACCATKVAMARQSVSRSPPYNGAKRCRLDASGYAGVVTGPRKGKSEPREYVSATICGIDAGCSGRRLWQPACSFGSRKGLNRPQ